MGVRRAWGACRAILSIAVAGCATTSDGPFGLPEPPDSGAQREAVDSAPPAPPTPAMDASGLGTPPAREAGPGYLTQSSEIDASDCSDAASSYVYVLSNQSDIYRFAPDQKTFTRIATISCAAVGQPNSMAVDRNTTAWVNFLGGTLQPISTTDGSCKGAAIPLPTAFTQVGMAYVAATASTDEALYVAGAYQSAGSGLASVDTTSGSLTPIGLYSGSLVGASAELTGTGDGRLFGFFVQSPPILGQIDPTTGNILSQTTLSTVTLTAASSFAFSFWGGRFYFYTYPNTSGSSTTDVSEYDPTTGTLNPTYMTDIGFTIVGAGVSTCAPVVPPIPK
jgi:hypothetical protein